MFNRLTKFIRGSWIDFVSDFLMYKWLMTILDDYYLDCYRMGDLVIKLEGPGHLKTVTVKDETLDRYVYRATFLQDNSKRRTALMVEQFNKGVWVELVFLVYNQIMKKKFGRLE